MKALWLENKAISFTPSAPLPAPSPPEVLIKVLKAGICNTDLELIKGYYPYTGIPGHEFIGIVVQGPDFLLNKRVVSEINAHCNNCRMCQKDIRTHCDNRTVLGIINRNGAMAEYLTMPADNLILVPDNVEDRVGVFCEPLAAALQIQEQIQIQSGDKVLVIGDGKLGLLIALTLGLTECELLVIGRHQSKLQILQTQGINTGGSDDVQERFYDIVVECTGNQQGIEMAMQALRPRGTLVLKSTYAGKTSVDMSRIVVNEFQLVGSRCGPMQKAMDLLASGKLDVTPLITAEYAIEQGLEAFDMAAVPGSLKVLINF